MLINHETWPNQSQLSNPILRTSLLSLVVICALVFLTQPDILVWRVGDLPFGNLLAVVGLLSGSASPMVASKRSSLMTTLALFSCLMALTWLPLGIILSGNLSLNFVNDASDSYYFMKFTYVAALSAMVCLAMTWLYPWWRNRTDD